MTRVDIALLGRFEVSVDDATVGTSRLGSAPRRDAGEDPGVGAGPSSPPRAGRGPHVAGRFPRRRRAETAQGGPFRPPRDRTRRHRRAPRRDRRAVSRRRGHRRRRRLRRAGSAGARLGRRRPGARGARPVRRRAVSAGPLRRVGRGSARNPAPAPSRPVAADAPVGGPRRSRPQRRAGQRRADAPLHRERRPACGTSSVRAPRSRPAPRARRRTERRGVRPARSTPGGDRARGSRTHDADRPRHRAGHHRASAPRGRRRPGSHDRRHRAGGYGEVGDPARGPGARPSDGDGGSVMARQPRSKEHGRSPR